ncbi:hypothetical protein ACHAWF_006818 [Thalassiosira exigua]
MASLIVDFPRRCTPFEPEPDLDCIDPDENDVEPRMKKPRTVRFSPISKLHKFDRPLDLDQEPSWYSREQEQEFKRRAKNDTLAIRLLKESGCEMSQVGSWTRSGDFCPFGLEQQLISKEYTQKRIIKRRLVVLAVLTEQARPASRSCDDRWERIARASSAHSEWARNQAQTIGSFQASHMHSPKPLT